MNAMERRLLPGTDLPVSPICYGVGSFGGNLDPGKDSDRLLGLYRDAGGNFLDTAHCYAFWTPGGAGSSERFLAGYIRRSGCRDLVIATKGGHPGAPGYRTVERWLSPARIEADVDDSLGRLEVERIDLYWLHRDETARPVAEIVETLNREIWRGRLRWLGASNWRPERIAEANAYAAAHGLRGLNASQPEFSLAKKNSPNPAPAADASGGNVMLFLEEPDQAWHRRTQLPVVPYTSTAGGYFASGGQSAKAAFDSSENRARLERAQSLARELGATPGQVALAWLLHQDFPVFPIIGTRNPEHLREDLGAAQVRLTAEQVRWLAG
jgi:aryl-alcohol dehydrogenase-like predicted oxidoreductase